MKTVNTFLGKMIPPTWAHLKIIRDMMDSIGSTEVYTTWKSQYGVDISNKLLAWQTEVIPELDRAIPLLVVDDMWDWADQLIERHDGSGKTVVIWSGSDRDRDIRRVIEYINSNKTSMSLRHHKVPRGDKSISGTVARKAADETDWFSFKSKSPCESLFESLSTHK